MACKFDHFKYLSHPTHIEGIRSTIRITNLQFISKMMQMTSSCKSIAGIISRTANYKYSGIFTWLVDLLWLGKISSRHQLPRNTNMTIYRSAVRVNSSFLFWISVLSKDEILMEYKGFIHPFLSVKSKFHTSKGPNIVLLGKLMPRTLRISYSKLWYLSFHHRKG